MRLPNLNSFTNSLLWKKTLLYSPLRRSDHYYDEDDNGARTMGFHEKVYQHGKKKSFMFWVWTVILPLSIIAVWAFSSSYEISLKIAVRDVDDRQLILYAYHETENARENAEFFIKHGVHDGADFVFILNGKTDLAEIIPVGNHITVVQRPNSCFDLGAHAEVLKSNGNALIKRHKRFIMLNASIRGPFMPTWSTDCWSEAFAAQVTSDTKLVGMSFNCQPVIGDRHVQSMIWATDKTGLNILLEKDITRCYVDIDDAVHAEAGATNAIREAGYKVKALMTSFSSSKDYVDTCTHGDLMFEGRYYDVTAHPYEMMFYKANRDINTTQVQLLTEWHDGWGYSSQEFCGINGAKRIRSY